MVRGLVFIPGLFPKWSIKILPKVTFWILCHVIKYRKSIIQENLNRCFPSQNIEKITTQYYRFLSMVTIEPFFTLKLSEDYLKSRVYGEYSEIVKAGEEGKNAITLLGHMGNWEWLSAVAPLYVTPFQVVCIYKKMSNPFMEKYINKARSKYGAICVEMKELPRFLMKARKGISKPILISFISDQIPSHNNTAVVPFFGTDMFFFEGFQKVAKKIEAKVFYLDSEVTPKGDYIYRSKLLHDFSIEPTYDELTLKFVQHLEKNIVNQPYNWLWSHRRWKRLPK